MRLRRTCLTLCLAALLGVLDTSAGEAVLTADFEPGEQAPPPPPTTTCNPCNPRLLNLPANVWVELHRPAKADWRRSPHAGAAYDSRRGTLLVFGSETHGIQWNNDVLEFDPVAETWTRHAPSSDPAGYRLDAENRPMSGEAEPRPWAMHSFDTLVYDPLLDALLVGSDPEHNPRRSVVSRSINLRVTWLYDLAQRRWRPLPDSGRPAPRLFAGSAAYDSRRDTVIAHLDDVWELGPARQHWIRVNPESGPTYHHNSVYDARHRVLLAFGESPTGNAVWVFRPGDAPGGPGSWQRREPAGAQVPADQHLPAAYHPRHGVTLLLPDRLEPDGGAAEAFLYDYATDRYQALPGAGLDFLLAMNYQMVYDPGHDVFLLVTGDWRAPAVVWALRLQPPNKDD